MRYLLLAGLLIASSPSLSTPESDYMIHCMGCHLASGQGKPPDVPAFDSTLARLAATSPGRAYLIGVPGASQSPLNNSELAAVLNWILKEYTGAAFKPFDEIELQQYRDRVMTNPVAVRARLVDKKGRTD